MRPSFAGHSTGPLPHPATQRQYFMGGRVGERAGAANTKEGAVMAVLQGMGECGHGH
jgi:hypothetical protein